jgi:hypothetical protein
MLLDEDPSHTAKGPVRLAEGFGVDLLWLPKRSPKLNPMDTLWGRGKDVVCADTQYATIDEQVDRFIDYRGSLSAWDALHTAGVYSRGFQWFQVGGEGRAWVSRRAKVTRMSSSRTRRTAARGRPVRPTRLTHTQALRTTSPMATHSSRTTPSRHDVRGRASLSCR